MSPRELFERLIADPLVTLPGKSKKILLTVALAIAATTIAFAQDIQQAELFAELPGSVGNITFTPHPA